MSTNGIIVIVVLIIIAAAAASLLPSPVSWIVAAIALLGALLQALGRGV